MVFLAVLRDPSLVHGRLHPAGEAVGRAGHVRLDPAAVLPALARPLARSFGKLPPGVQALLLAVGRRYSDPRIHWRSADHLVANRSRPGCCGLLLPSLSRDPAPGLGVRDAVAAAALDFRERAARRSGRGGSAGANEAAARCDVD